MRRAISPFGRLSQEEEVADEARPLDEIYLSELTFEFLPTNS